MGYMGRFCEIVFDMIRVSYDEVWHLRQRSHNQLTCEYYEIWFDWKDPNDMVFRNIFSHFLNPKGTTLASLDKRTHFTSKPAKNQVKWRKTRETSDAIFLKNQDKPFKHHHYHHLLFYDRFHRVRSSVFVCDKNLVRMPP